MVRALPFVCGPAFVDLIVGLVDGDGSLLEVDVTGAVVFAVAVVFAAVLVAAVLSMTFQVALRSLVWRRGRGRMVNSVAESLRHDTADESMVCNAEYDRIVCNAEYDRLILVQKTCWRPVLIVA